LTTGAEVRCRPAPFFLLCGSFRPPSLSPAGVASLEVQDERLAQRAHYFQTLGRGQLLHDVIYKVLDIFDVGVNVGNDRVEVGSLPTAGVRFVDSVFYDIHSGIGHFQRAAVGVIFDDGHHNSARARVGLDHGDVFQQQLAGHALLHVGDLAHDSRHRGRVRVAPEHVNEHNKHLLSGVLGGRGCGSSAHHAHNHVRIVGTPGKGKDLRYEFVGTVRAGDTRSFQELDENGSPSWGQRSTGSAAPGVTPTPRGAHVPLQK
jgi:hypothetical protein